MRIKVTDGDFIVVKVNNGFEKQDVDTVKKRFKKWITERGLQNCELLIVHASEGPFGIDILSVNDVFESQVLGAEKP